MSNEVMNIYEAYIAAKKELAGTHIEKSATNPHFKRGYAELKDYLKIVDPILAQHGLALMQPVSTEEDRVFCETIIYHISGDSLRSPKLGIKPDKATPQGVGSAITYARRYSLASFLGLAAEDDDGNAAEGDGKKKANKPPSPEVPEAKTEDVPPVTKDGNEPPTENGDISAAQVGMIHGILKGLGIEDDLAKHVEVSIICGFNHTVGSMKYLSKSDASKVIKALQAQAKTHGQPTPEEISELEPF